MKDSPLLVVCHQICQRPSGIYRCGKRKKVTSAHTEFLQVFSGYKIKEEKKKNAEDPFFLRIQPSQSKDLYEAGLFLSSLTFPSFQHLQAKGAYG